MLAVTQNAIDAIRQVAPGEAGLRLFRSDAPSDGSPALAVAVAEEPIQGDEVFELRGAHLFLEPAVVPLVDEKLLDATVAATGVHFTLAEQG